MSHSRFSQADMVALGRRIYQFALADIADFSAFDASITPTYLSLLDVAIIAAESHPDDETVVDIQTGYTNALFDVEKKCRKAYQRLKVFVEKAFPSVRSVQNEFGFNDYVDVTTMADLIKFMRKIADTAAKYSSDLVGVAYPLNDIADLAILHDKLVNALSEQSTYKSERMRLTDKREELLNKVYEYVSFLCKVGKIIYEDSRAQYARYLLPATSTNNTPTARISNQARAVVAANVLANQYFTLRVLNSGMPLQFYIAPNGSTSVPSNAVTIAPATVGTDISVEDLGFDANLTGAQSLFVYNPNTVEVGYALSSLS